MDLIKCLAVIFLIDSVNSIKDVKLNNLKLETVVKLLNILDKFQKNIQYIHVQPNLKEYNKNNINVLKDLATDKKFVHPKYQKKRTWIKRLVPHGLPPSNLEFDAKYKTIYRPLIRIHKRKRLPNVPVMLNVNGNKNDGVDKYGIDVHDYFDNDENVINFVKNNEPEEILKNVEQVTNVDEDLLQPFAYHLIDRKIKEVEHILKKFRSRPAPLDRIDKIAKILNELKNLRTHEKSGEDNTPTAHGLHHHHEAEIVKMPKKTLQHYPPWNYWTYKKTIHQDQCPKGQARINDRCIWLPPH